MYVRRTALDAIVAHAKRESPRECCGLLIGTEGEIIEAVAAANVAGEPERRYEVAPRDHFEQVRRRRAGAGEGSERLDVVGAYHSHPRSSPNPSPTDAELACEEFVYLIAGPVEGPGPLDVRGFRFRQGAFEVLTLVPV